MIKKYFPAFIVILISVFFVQVPKVSAQVSDFTFTSQGPHSVYQGQSVYFGVFGTLVSGPDENVGLSVTGLPPGATSSFPDLEASCCTTFAYNTNFYTSVKVTVPLSVAPGTYTLTVTANKNGLIKTIAYPLTVKAVPAAVTLPTVDTVTPVPPLTTLSQWETQMTTFGTQHCVPEELTTWEGNVWYYDGARVYFQIGDYTGDPKWYTCAASVLSFFRDSYVIANNGSIPGWRKFTDGMKMDYQRNGTAASKQGALLLVPNYPLSIYIISWDNSREVAYGINNLLNAEELGQGNPAQLTKLVDITMGYFDQWFVSKNATLVQPFMVGLSSDAMIRYYEKTHDPRVPEILKIAMESLWNKGWDPISKSFLYDQVGPAPDLNLLIGPAYGWLYQLTGDTKWRDRGDQIFNSGVSQAYLYGGKQFSQNYRWSFDYIKWRSKNYTTASTPPGDTTPPTFSAIVSGSTTQTSTSISWTTNESSDTQVEYGLTTSYGASSGLNTTLSTSHTVSLSGLTANTVYHYRVKSRDAAGNLGVSADQVFTTSAAVTPVKGDLNLDHVINSVDYSLLGTKWNQNYPTYDLLVDGIINSLDFAYLSSNWLLTW